LNSHRNFVIHFVPDQMRSKTSTSDMKRQQTHSEEQSPRWR